MTKIFNPNPVSEEDYNKGQDLMGQLVKGGSNSSAFGNYQEYVDFVKQRNQDMVGRGADPSIMNGQLPAQNLGLDRAMSSLERARTYGVARLTANREGQEQRSFTDKFANGYPAEELPTGPGYNYMTHLFNKHNMKDKIENQRMKYKDNIKIFTEEMEAVKSALAQMGIYSDKNPGGLPIDFKEARNIFFGEDDVDPIKEAEWRTQIEVGDSKIDPKRIRKFTNYDGSLTWELLNHDKTVSSRFTLGDYNGTKIFAQGGYGKFAELLKKARQKLGPNIQGRFDAIRGMFGG